MRILHVISGDLWAGAEAMAYQLLSGLNRLEDIELHLIILNEGRLESLCRQEGIHCHLIEEQKLPSFGIAWRAIQIARRIKPDIIHSHRYKENILSALVSFFCGSPKLVATQHGRTEGDKTPFPKNIIAKLNQACLRRIFTQVIAVSNDTADYLLKSCELNPIKLTIVPNGIEMPTNLPPIKDMGSDKTFTVGSAGRLFPVKRFATFIDIARQVCRNRGQARFHIAGEGPERKKLEKLITEYVIGRQVSILGHIDDMQSFFKSINLYVNTSMHEGSPMSIIEAMAYGLPVIAFGVAGLREIITDGIDGFTIPEGDDEQFVNRIKELIENPKILIELGKNARWKIQSRFSKARMVEKYRELYYRVF